ncbi:MAG TPA: hypothetical protein VM782_18885 [Stellaceae bacterium]|nr:hypothetical protein [Stellaceae bacterium]
MARHAAASRVRVILAACVMASLALTAAHAQPGLPPAPSGTTPETAITLPGIVDEFHGVVAEHAYIADHFPTWHIEYQTRLNQNDRDYDLLGMIEPDHTKTVIYFDITDWVGK